MNVKKVQFIDGVVGEKDILFDGIPQVAFIGRSNVGKSSTLNTLLGKTKLVKTGKTPGKTKEINFFKVECENEDIFYFVDLPGYGYAKLSKKDRDTLHKLIVWYLEHKISFLELVVLIIDAKVGLTDLDRDFIRILDTQKKPFILAINKVDKINQKTKSLLQKEIRKELSCKNNLFDIIYYSAAKNKQIHLLTKSIFNFFYAE